MPASLSARHAISLSLAVATHEYPNIGRYVIGCHVPFRPGGRRPLVLPAGVMVVREPFPAERYALACGEMAALKNGVLSRLLRILSGITGAIERSVADAGVKLAGIRWTALPSLVTGTLWRGARFTWARAVAEFISQPEVT